MEVFYVDSGGSGRVNLTNVCNGYPPMLHKLPKQAAQCSLQGVQLVMCVCGWVGGWRCVCVYMLVEGWKSGWIGIGEADTCICF